MQDGRRRRLVDLAALDPDEAILDVVDPPDPMSPAEDVQAFDQLHGTEPLAVERHRHATLERDHDLHRVGCVCGGDRPLVGVGRWGDPRVLEDAGLAGTTP
jgi:hypothetical protein